MPPVIKTAKFFTTIAVTSLAVASSLSITFSPSIAQSQSQTTAFQRWIRIAQQARQRGDYDTALINYGRANREQPRDSDVAAAVSALLEERLQSLKKSNPEYVKSVRVADKAYYAGDYDTAIINYRRALNERFADHYASTRIQQAKCTKAEQPGTLSQFELMCPSLFPSED
jgi:tetratricopeptide (TPR) repeat protein